METQIQSTSPEPKPQNFKLYRGRAPILLQIIGGLMWLAGIRAIFGALLLGFSLLLIFIPLNFAFTVLLIIFGILSIKYAKSIFKMEKKCFNPVVIMYGLLILGILGLAIKDGFDNETWINLGSGLFVIVTLFLHRKKFTY